MDYTHKQQEAYVGLITDGQPNDSQVASSLSLTGSLQGSSNMGIIRREKSENYSVIYNECFQNPELSARAKGIFAYLMTLPDDWKIYKRELTKHFKEGRDALNKAFEELEGCGYITKKPERGEGGRLGGWDYTVYESTDLLKTRNTVNPLDGESATTKYLSSESTNPTKEGAEEKSIAENRESSNQGSIPEKENLSSSEVARFNTFWAVYPKKKDKANALKAFRRALKKIDFGDMVSAISKVKMSHDWTKDNGQYIPLAATWLNGERWADEVGSSTSGGDQGYMKNIKDYED